MEVAWRAPNVERNKMNWSSQKREATTIMPKRMESMLCLLFGVVLIFVVVAPDVHLRSYATLVRTTREGTHSMQAAHALFGVFVGCNKTRRKLLGWEECGRPVKLTGNAACFLRTAVLPFCGQS